MEFKEYPPIMGKCPCCNELESPMIMNDAYEYLCGTIEYISPSGNTIVRSKQCIENEAKQKENKNVYDR
ncbi:MAG: hypothetical protein M0R17_00980 [Candidatus Omnitrophica bacterium]|jgi:hypothetical protein|nr:hypothetical protein [Candidatus Omnitrophota bacterium]